MSRVLALLVAICVCGAAVATLLSASTPSSASARPSAARSAPRVRPVAPRVRPVFPVAGHLRYAIGPHPRWPDPAASAGRSQVVILLPWQHALMHELKAANPRLIVLEYKNLANTTSYAPVDGLSPDGVTYTQALAHPAWLLRDRAGRPIRPTGYPDQWALDIGSQSFQQAWAAEVVDELEAEGWDGVFIDNLNPTIRFYHDPADVRAYPSDNAYAAATTAALDYIAPRIHAADKLVMGNIGSWPEHPELGAHWLEQLDGAMDERFVKYDDTPRQGYRPQAEWQAQLSILQRTQREGKWFLGITESSDSDVAAERYGWATTLLGSAGRATYALQNDTDYGTDRWFADYDAPLGPAVGDESEAASGVHQRSFAHGEVLVNPTAVSHTVGLDGRYSGDGLHDVDEVTLAPHSSLILIKQRG